MEDILTLLKNINKTMNILSLKNNYKRHQFKPVTGPHEEKPTHPLPMWMSKYCWTHGMCTHHSEKKLNHTPGNKKETKK